MSDTDSKIDNNKPDSRILCKYGDKCYQKNPAHHSKYKHPPKQSKRKNNPMMKASKRVKLNTEISTPTDTLEENSEKETVSSGDTFEDNEKESETSRTLIGEKKKECISSSDSEQNDEASEEQKFSNKVEKEKECISSSDSEQNEILEHKLKDDKAKVQDKGTEEEKSLFPESSELQEKNKSESADEEKSIPESNKPFNPKEFIKTRFLVDMPSDFYDFWEFCKELKPTAPCDALKDVGLKLVGPYDVLAGKFKHTKKSPEEYLRHWRYYYDIPEVFTVIKGDDKSGYHIGYFYDSPNEAPSFLVSNHGTKDGIFTKMGDNIFAAVSLYLEELKKIGDPFKKMHVGKFLSKIKTQAEKLNLNLSSHSKRIKEREFKVVAKSFNKIGIVVPYNKKTQLGYRGLAMEDKELMSLLTKLEKAAPEQKSKYLSDLQPVLTFANIALDECDFGTGVKLGWEIMYHGIDSLNSTISQFLANSYRLLNKEAFAKIAEAHMSHRKKGCDLSIV